MELTWSLDTMYLGYDDPKFQNDMQGLDAAVGALIPALEKAKRQSAEEGLTTVLEALEQVSQMESNLFRYVMLRQSTASTDGETASILAQISRKSAEATEGKTAIRRFIAQIPNLEQVVQGRDFLREYEFLCLELKKNAAHMLSDETEDVLSKMDLSGGSAWGRLFDFLTSTLQVDYNGEAITLSEVRNLAYSADPAVRREAYEAELAAYGKIRDSIAFSLNSIKNQVVTEAQLRGYDSPLAMTLEQSRMQKKTLDAMFAAMEEGFPKFHKYLRAKAKLLGHEGGLPWYDLFAPVGKTEFRFTVEETKDYLVRVFSGLASDFSELIRQAFDERWIDFMPAAGKVGGAFCENVPGQDQSRILTNFSGDFDSVNTLAHELGHAYHNRQMKDHRIMNQDCPMPVAETASTFNETHLAIYALSGTEDRDEKLAILELLLSGAAQTICDIYSRVLFEDAVFGRCAGEFMMADQLAEIMENAQKKAYGNGLDQSTLHPYMWCCKGHYYSSGLSYYNFPYAFGTLFSMGLYAQYRKEGEPFLEKYRALLHATAVKSLEEIGTMAGVDLTTPEFWRESINLFGDFIDQYCELAES